MSPEPTRPETSAEKISLFRQLFRGRDDLYPKLWTNTTTGRKGYAPACANEWVRGICEKPRVKCGECPNQAFLAVTDQVTRDHLQGRHVVGERRLRGYRAIGYARDDGPLDDEAGSGDATGVAGTAEIPATPSSRKPRRPRTGRRLRQPSRAPW